MAQKMYHVIVFTATDTVDVVPGNWLQNRNTVCMWPGALPGHKVAKAVKSQQEPGSGWKAYAVRVLCTTCKYCLVICVVGLQ
jgi:hypothetical protein